MTSSTGRWVSGPDFFDRETELRILEERGARRPTPRAHHRAQMFREPGGATRVETFLRWLRSAFQRFVGDSPVLIVSGSTGSCR